MVHLAGLRDNKEGTAAALHGHPHSSFHPPPRHAPTIFAPANLSRPPNLEASRVRRSSSGCRSAGRSWARRGEAQRAAQRDDQTHTDVVLQPRGIDAQVARPGLSVEGEMCMLSPLDAVVT